MKFQRGKNPKESIEIGLQSRIKELTEKYIGRPDKYDQSECILKAGLEERDLEVVRYALARGASLEADSPKYPFDVLNDYAPMMTALYSRDLRIIQLILDAKADPNCIMQYSLISGLEWVISESLWDKSKYTKIFYKLITAGVDVNLKNGGPLLQAMIRNNHQMVKALIKAGATLTSDGGRIIKFIKSNDKYKELDSRIHFAIRNLAIKENKQI